MHTHIYIIWNINRPIFIHCSRKSPSWLLMVREWGWGGSYANRGHGCHSSCVSVWLHEDKNWYKLIVLEIHTFCLISSQGAKILRVTPQKARTVSLSSFNCFWSSPSKEFLHSTHSLDSVPSATERCPYPSTKHFMFQRRTKLLLLVSWGALHPQTLTGLTLTFQGEFHGDNNFWKWFLG